jgi:glycerol uptake operon antiterminator
MEHFNNQKILPAANNIKEFEKLMETDFEYVILLNSHIAQLTALMKLARRHQKKVLLHVDLVQGLRSDEYGAEYLCQKVKPAGLISTRTPVIQMAKKRSLIAIQRIFLLDSHALNTSYRLIQSFQPDYIEVLPGIIPHIIREISDNTNVPILAGGLIRTVEEAREALQAGAVAITTSEQKIWNKINEKEIDL